VGDARSVNVAPSLGAVSESLAIEVSPGRRGVEPRLVLTYSSMAGNGDEGLGWRIELGRVERWPGDGRPTVGDPDSYLYSLSGAGGELRNTGGGVYRAEIESVYREFRKLPDDDGDGSFDGWITSNGEGGIHRFGGTPDSRIEGQVWMLDRVEDPSGNTITYSYERVNNGLYPKEIRYTGHMPTGDPGANRVVFTYEDRPDERISYRNQVREEQTRRLRSLSVYASDLLTRRYVLIYDQSPVNGQSLLTRIDLVGSDDASSITLRRIDYTTRALGWDGEGLAATLPVNFTDAEDKDTGARIADVNSDGFSDLLDNGQHVYLGDSTGAFAESPSWSGSLAGANVNFVQPSGDYKGGDRGVRVVDVNTDGRPDLFIARPERREVWLNTGTGWIKDDGWSASLQSLKAEATIDPAYLQPPTLEGDDIINLPSLATKLKQHIDSVSLFLWDGFTTPTRILLNNYPDTTDPAVLRAALVVELNEVIQGDNIYDEQRFADVTLSDRTEALLNQDPSGIWLERLNRLLLEDAYPDELADSYPPPGYTQQYDGEVFALVENQTDWKGVVLTDVNADGRLDILWSMDRSDYLYWQDERIPIRLRAVFLNNGSGWVESPILTQALFDFLFVKDSQVQGYDVSDANADGFADIVRTFEGEPREVFLGTGQGWTKDDSYTASLQENNILSLNADRESQGLMPLDFDDDGLVDYLQANGAVRRALRNTGTGWEPSSDMTDALTTADVDFNTTEGDATGVVLGDIDGDGLADLLRAKEGEPARMWLTAKMRSGLLSRATTTLGGVTELEWANSTEFDNRRTDGLQGMPNPVPVATSLTRHDGRGNAYETTYHYEGGLFESSQFRGFRRCVQSLPSGLVVDSTYRQEEGLAGQLDISEARDSKGQVRSRETAVYAIEESTPPVRQVRLVQSDRESIDPGGVRHSRAIYEHDGQLNTTQVQRDPDVEVSGDESTTRFTWVRNEAAGIWAIPSRVQTFDSDGAMLKETVVFYDGLPEGQAVKALPSETLDWVEGGEYVSRTTEYDGYGNVVRAVDRAGNASRFAYDEATNTFRVWAIDPEGRELNCEYDPRFGELVRDVDPGGNVVTKEYDAFGRAVRVHLPGDQGSPFGTETYTYSPMGDPSSQFYRIQEIETPGNPNALSTTSFFDAMGMVYRVERLGIGGRKSITLTEYNEAGNVIATTRPYFEGDEVLGTLIERDEMQRPIRVEEPDGLGLTLSHAGPRAEMTDRRGNTTSYIRNGDGKVTEIHQWIGGEEQVTHYQYDPLGRLTSIVDALGEETHIAYDGLGRRTRLEDASAGTYEYHYDGEGRLIAQTAPDGRITQFEYNRAGDLVRKEFPDGTAQEFFYGAPDAGPEAAGRLIRVHDAAGALDLKYDRRGNVIERRRAVLDRTFVTGYTYDLLDRIRRVTYPDGFQVNYEYDAGGNLARLADGDGKVVAEGMEYTAAGQLSTIMYGNGAVTGFDYDNLLRMTSIYTLLGEGTTLQDLTYHYDAGGNILSMEDGAHGASQTFEYDEISRLIKAVGPYGEETYEYDAIGNLLRKGNLAFTVDPVIPQRVIGVEDLNAGVDAYAGPVNSAGAAASGNSKGNPHTANTFDLEYDERGNVIRKGNRRFEYDAENQLVRVREGNGRLIEENVYDASGQRVIQRTPQETTLFIDGIYEVGQTHAARHIRSGAMLVATSVVPRAAVRLISEAPREEIGAKGGLGHAASACLVLGCLVGLGLVRESMRKGRWGRRGLVGLVDLGTAARRRPWMAILTVLIAVAFVNNLAPYPVFGAKSLRPQDGQQTPAERRYYYHLFHLGSVNVVTSDNGSVVSWRNYRPYGESFNWTGPNAGPRELHQTFNGQRHDDATGLYYFGARHYDAQLGRFLTADTIVSDPLNPKTLNRYAFAGGNPIRYQDPSGHAWWDWVIGIFVAVVLIVVGVILIVVTFGAATPVVVAGLVFGLAFLGAGVMAAYALSQGLSPLKPDFWLATAAGFVLGAALGAGLAALPAALGFASVGWVAALAANIVLGLAVGIIERAAAYLASGGGPEGLLADLFSTEALITYAIGVGITILTFGLAKGVARWAATKFAGAAASKLAKFGKFLLKGFRVLVSLSWQVGRVVYAGLFGRTIGQTILSGAQQLGRTVAIGFQQFTVGLLVFVAILSEGVGGGGDSDGNSMQLQTMPLAP